MWVKKIPERYDFCGCPPCGLCYDWVEPITEEVVEGIVHIATELLDRGPSFLELKAVEQGLVENHARLKAGLVTDQISVTIRGESPLQLELREKQRLDRTAKEYEERRQRNVLLDNMQLDGAATVRVPAASNPTPSPSVEPAYRQLLEKMVAENKLKTQKERSALTDEWQQRMKMEALKAREREDAERFRRSYTGAVDIWKK